MKSSFGIQFRMKKFFFDKPHVKRRIGKKKAKLLSMGGAYTRRRARSKLRRRKRVSRAGEPPSVHSESDIANLRTILFALDKETDSVIIGPVKLNQVNLGADLERYTVPELLEIGGTIDIREEAIVGSNEWRRRDMRRSVKQWKKYRTRRATYDARPYMNPSLKETAEEVPELFARSMASP